MSTTTRLNDTLLWAAAFLSPTLYALMLVAWATLRAPAPPAALVVALFCLIPVAALLFCVTKVWRSGSRPAWRVNWVVLTVLGMMLQMGVLLLVIVSAITVAISLPQ